MYFTPNFLKKAFSDSTISYSSSSSSFESSAGFTNPPSTDSGGGIFFDFPNPIVVIITDDKIIKKISCGYASEFGNPIVIGYVASTAAANPLGIIEFVTALSKSENLFVNVIFPTNILPK